MESMTSSYPATLDVEYPDRELSRLTTFFRIFTVIPIGIILALLSGHNSMVNGDAAVSTNYNGGASLFLATVLMLLFRQTYPRWWFDWQLALARFAMRVEAYLCLLRDEYPAVEQDQAIRVEIDYPNAQTDLNRWLPLIKWLFAFPHYVVLLFLSIAAMICVVIAWFAILFTGRYPRGLFDFVVGVMNYWLRVVVYAFMLTTDRYPPFSL
ncbi:MAG: DUF4389 domain-containing protein [Gemmatimonadetes bacterium]|jgi:F0F1-type ATP synthase assembly protein I|nr:DUF4389 domain-containing protein [Gemmatimonadota bacterium]MBT5060228.1 DUF4389 domain-containing protein [Gemmatimonadota bacterium]MBT5146426.1 DUF4389 domain-containing protein [Gemmatimonadota bacterium]MBT5591348.1 DUF4389 domain-containing protein [Gemmatimonadota bacterium]MBT5962197.1 DUF4389 domain-containing protein [Gemmatimonadota bacterium]